MKKILLFLILIFVSSSMLAQTQKAETTDLILSNRQRYSIDYELKDMFIVNDSIISLINLSNYEHLRDEIDDVEVLDVYTNAIVVLYSMYKTSERKRNTINNILTNDK